MSIGDESLNNNSLDNNRIVFLDNIRSLTVLFVLVFHAGAAYSSAVDFWPYHNSSYSGLVDFYMLLGDVFMMSNMFFIAGYFATPSYNKRGAKVFVKDKFKTLGLPWLTITTCVLPVLDYINYVFVLEKAGNLGFVEYWVRSMKKILEFNFGFLDMSKFTIMPEQYYQRYVWFLALLIFFFLAFVVYMKLKEKLHVKEVSSENKSKLIPFVVVSVLSIVLFGGVKLFIYDEILGSGWYSFGGLLEFQLGKFFIYAIYFGFGIYAYNRKWFTVNGGIGKVWAWAVGNFCAFGMNMLAFKVLSETSTPDLIYKLMHVVLYPLWTLTFLGLFLSIGYKYWNNKSWFNGELAKNSYKMYLVHYMFPMTLPLMLSGVEVGVFVKFIIVAVFTVVFSYLASKVVLRVRWL